MDENKRLLELLKYAKEAISYWYDSVDCDDDVREENDNFKKECDYFINKFSLGSNE